MREPDQQKAYLAQKVTLIGMLLDILLGILKLLAGSLAYSHALIADGIHSLSDAATDIFVLIVNRISYHGPDENHPYGHARFETLGTVFLGCALITVALLLAYNYLLLFFEPRESALPGWPALAVAFISIVSKEWIFQYTRKTGELLGSNLLIANAWHSRTDALSSIIVFVSIAGTMLGIAWLDLTAALIVAMIVGKIGVQLVWDSLKELVDTGIGPEDLAAMRDTLLSVEGIRDVHDMRTRRMGQNIMMDVHLVVNPSVSVSEGHQIGAWAARELLRRHRHIADVLYHIDPEDDQNVMLTAQSRLLPLRSEVKQLLRKCWQDGPEIQHLKLHYLENKIDVEVYFNKSDIEQTTSQQLTRELTQKAVHLDWLGTIRIGYISDQRQQIHSHTPLS